MNWRSSIDEKSSEADRSSVRELHRQQIHHLNGYHRIALEHPNMSTKSSQRSQGTENSDLPIRTDNRRSNSLASLGPSLTVTASTGSHVIHHLNLTAHVQGWISRTTLDACQISRREDDVHDGNSAETLVIDLITYSKRTRPLLSCFTRKLLSIPSEHNFEITHFILRSKLCRLPSSLECRSSKRAYITSGRLLVMHSPVKHVFLSSNPTSAPSYSIVGHPCSVVVVP